MLEDHLCHVLSDSRMYTTYCAAGLLVCVFASHSNMCIEKLPMHANHTTLGSLHLADMWPL